jgi:hypothetical protein
MERGVYICYAEAEEEWCCGSCGEETGMGCGRAVEFGRGV